MIMIDNPFSGQPEKGVFFSEIILFHQVYSDLYVIELTDKSMQGGSR